MAATLDILMPPPDETVVVVSGLPRSGTSMIMQMVAAGGFPVLSDGIRGADLDNPRGYLEYEPVKNLLRDAGWVAEAKGKAVKVVAPLLRALPKDLAYRVILIERDFNEVLDSQAQMLLRRNKSLPDTPERRNSLREAFGRSLREARDFLRRHPRTRLLVLQQENVLRDPAGAAAQINDFLGGHLDVLKMAAEVDPSLHRQRGLHRYVRR
jgi:hypothetical protein